MEGLISNDLREFVKQSRNIGEVEDIDGIDWNLEIGALTEAAAELLKDPPMLLFDNIQGHKPGYRVMGLPIASYKRSALALGLPLDKSKLELVRLAAKKVREAQPIAPVFVNDGPVMENVLLGDDVDLLRFPAPHFHAFDGGRYIGTGDSLINQDPESRFINVGTYRMQIHDSNLLGLWMSPGQQGRMICQRYWDQGKSCPVVAIFGQHPLSFMVSQTKFPWGKSELDIIGGLRQQPVQVIKGPITGLPIPADAEIAIEGEVPPPSTHSRAEGPFGEWPGYYSGGTKGTGEMQPVIHVKAIYHRNQPILHDQSPLWTGATNVGLKLSSGILWDQLEAAGIQDIAGVYHHNPYFVAVSIRQRYAGHAKQAGLAALSCAAAARNGRYVVVVDDDIDPTDMREVLWAMETRVDPASNIDLIDGCWSTPLDPRMPPECRETRNYINSRAIFYAVRPFYYINDFPKVSRTDRELREQIVEKYQRIFSKASRQAL